MGSPVGCQPHDESDAHQAKNDSSSASRLAAWSEAYWVVVSDGSMAPSSTMALTWVGKSWAYSAPNRVP